MRMKIGLENCLRTLKVNKTLRGQVRPSSPFQAVSQKPCALHWVNVDDYHNKRWRKFELTRIRPVVVCPEMSSPAQSLASVIKVPSNSLFWRAAFCSFCLGSFGATSGSFRQQRKAKALQSRTMSSPARKVKMLERTKHHHFRTLRHSASSSWGCSVVSSYVIPAADLCWLPPGHSFTVPSDQPAVCF